jgi:excisionase family DNA binding protein
VITADGASPREIDGFHMARLPALAHGYRPIRNRRSRVPHTLPVPETMTVIEAAHTLGIAERTVYSMIDAGRIPSLRISNRILVLRSVIRAILDEGRAAPEPVSDEVW